MCTCGLRAEFYNRNGSHQYGNKFMCDACNEIKKDIKHETYW